MGILGEQREKGAVKIFEKMAENCENYSMKIMNLHIQPQWSLNRISTKESTTRPIIVKMLRDKDKDKILKATRENQLMV